MSARLGLAKLPFSWKKQNACASYAGEKAKTSGKKQDYPRREKTPASCHPFMASGRQLEQLGRAEGRPQPSLWVV